MLPDDRELQPFRYPGTQGEGGFIVLVPALPEVVTEGDTEEEALAMAEDAIRPVLYSFIGRSRPRRYVPRYSPSNFHVSFDLSRT